MFDSITQGLKDIGSAAYGYAKGTLQTTAGEFLTKLGVEQTAAGQQSISQTDKFALGLRRQLGVPASMASFGGILIIGLIAGGVYIIARR